MPLMSWLDQDGRHPLTDNAPNVRSGFPAPIFSRATVRLTGPCRPSSRSRILTSVASGLWLALATTSVAVAQDAERLPADSATAAPAAEPDGSSFFGTGLKVSLGLGTGLAPAYEGAKRLKVAPVPFVDVEGLFGDRVSLSMTRGLAFKFVNQKHLKAGVNVNYSPGRSAGDSDRLNGLPDIADAATVGGFLSYEFAPFSVGIAVENRLGPNSGATLSLDGKYTFRPMQRLEVSAGPTLTFADHRYEETFFGVSGAAAAQATALGNPMQAYDAHAGLKDVGLSLSARYAISAHWLVAGYAGLSELVGSAADSPLTQRKLQPRVAAGLIYKF